MFFPIRFLKDLTIVVLFLTLTFLTACDDDSDDIGIGVIDQNSATGTLHIDTIYATDIERVKSFMDSQSTGNADRLYLGSVDNQDFRVLMRFFFPNNVLDSAIVTGARLRLFSSGYFGSAGSFTANIHAVTKQWTPSDLLWDRFQAGADYGPVMSSKVVTASAAETEIRISFPVDTVQKWFNFATSDSADQPGILIDFAGASYVQQFYSGLITRAYTSGVDYDSSRVPRLEVDYQIMDRKTGLPKEIGTYPFIPAYVRGLRNGGYHGYIYRDRNPQDVNTITVGGGLPYHALIRFKTDSLPENLSINQAILQLKVDHAGDYLYSPGDSVQVQLFPSITDTADWKPGKYSLNYQNGFINDNIADDILQLKIPAILQDWATRPVNNKGFVLSNEGEFGRSGLITSNFQRLYRVRFFGPSASKEDAPKIIVYYTLPPK